MPPAPLKDHYTLVADIGGTNTRVALAEGRTLVASSVQRYSNAEYPGLETVLRHYLESQGGIDCAGACIAVAGPVRDGVATMTNLDWTMDLDTLARATGAETVEILNDLQAQGHAIGHIPEASVRTMISGGETREGATRLVVGVGTGFNAAPVFETGAGRIVEPSESGHQNLPIRTEADLRLATFLETIHGFPSVEDVLSGRGLERVYAWLGHEAGDPREMAARDIMAALGAGNDARAGEAAAVFVRMLGAVCGNLALIFLPFGGVYLAGGVARAITPFLDRFDFADAFRDKGRFAGFMKNFAVSVIEDDFAALTGCASAIAGRR